MSGWRQRFSALYNVPFILDLAWRAAPRLLAVSVIARIVIAFLPLTALWISKLIIDLAVWSTTHPGPVPDAHVVARFSRVPRRGHGRRPGQGDRLLRSAAGRRVFTRGQPSGDASCHVARSPVVRGSVFLRHARTRTRTGERSSDVVERARQPDSADRRPHFVFSRCHLLFRAGVSPADCVADPCIRRRDPLCVPRLFARSPVDAAQARAGLHPDARHEQGERKGDATVRARPAPVGSLRADQQDA